jgi:hypothetical protein
MSDADNFTMQRDTSKHRTKRSRAQRAADLVLVENWAVRGKSQLEIADLLSSQRDYRISRSQVQFDLARLRDRWMAASLQTFADARAAELRKLDFVETELWQQWDEGKSGAEGGNPAFTGQILAVHDRRAKLLGLSAPSRAEVTGADGAAIRIEATAISSGPVADGQKLEVLRRHIARMEHEAAATAAAVPVSTPPAT